MSERAIPERDADERTTLRGWLEFHRATFASKHDGLDVAQLRWPAAEPSSMSLLGLLDELSAVAGP
jgi:hypothetical protein